MRLGRVNRNFNCCPLCKSEKILTNRAHTVFCQNCFYDTSRLGVVHRNITHALYQACGFRIREDHPDAKKVASMIDAT